MIEKIIRKVGVEKRQKYKNINERNYLRIVRDLMGIRILILSKEEWRTVHDFLLKLMKIPDMICIWRRCQGLISVMGIVTFLNYTIHKEYTDKGYRSQHYIFKYGELLF